MHNESIEMTTGSEHNLSHCASFSEPYKRLINNVDNEYLERIIDHQIGDLRLANVPLQVNQYAYQSGKSTMVEKCLDKILEEEFLDNPYKNCLRNN